MQMRVSEMTDSCDRLPSRPKAFTVISEATSDRRCPVTGRRLCQTGFGAVVAILPVVVVARLRV
jgi:hypothetical protein